MRNSGKPPRFRIEDAAGYVVVGVVRHADDLPVLTFDYMDLQVRLASLGKDLNVPGPHKGFCFVYPQWNAASWGDAVPIYLKGATVSLIDRPIPKG